jgi:heme-degrading monooxygenase HmoA
MSVLVTMRVGPVDWARFRAALEWLYTHRPPEWLSHRVYHAERDPSLVLVIDEWTSHAAFDAFAERVGPEFNERAGTSGLAWQDEVWVIADIPSFPTGRPSG